MQRRDFLKDMLVTGAAITVAGMGVGPVVKKGWGAQEKSGHRRVQVGQGHLCVGDELVRLAAHAAGYQGRRRRDGLKYDIPWTQSNIGGYVRTDRGGAARRFQAHDPARYGVEIRDWTDYVMDKSGRR